MGRDIKEIDFDDLKYYLKENQEWMNAPMGPPVKIIGYKTLRGFVSMLKKQNKSLKKLGCVADFTIRLPIRY